MKRRNSVLNESELVSVTTSLFHERSEAGTESELTPRILREEVARRIGLEDVDVLKDPLYKRLLQDVVLAEAVRIRSGEVTRSGGPKKKDAKETKKNTTTITQYKSAEFVQDTSDVEVLSDQSSKTKKRRVLSTDLSDENTADPKSVNKSKRKNKDTSVKRSKKSSIDASSKHDATVKRLKGIVLACGIRKIWSKEFASLPDPSSVTQQVKHLKDLLASLGMVGRSSLEKAKMIREKRELAQELEDVNTFNEKINATMPRRQSKAAVNARMSDSESDDVLASNAARRQIQAFLGDDSSDES